MYVYVSLLKGQLVIFSISPHPNMHLIGGVGGILKCVSLLKISCSIFFNVKFGELVYKNFYSTFK